MFPQEVLDEMWRKATVGVVYSSPPRNHNYIKPKSKFAPKNQREDWLTDDQVRTIKEKLAKGETSAAIARQHGVLRITVSQIKRGLTYAHVQ